MQSQDLVWVVKPYADLTKDELYALLAFRVAVFVVEQYCPYQEVDGKDLHCLHVMGYRGDAMVAYARIVQPGISYFEVSIGRVATHADIRKTGLGKQLMQVTLAAVEAHFGKKPVRISAQSYLVPFYQSFGFETVGHEYLEDDMPHIEMYRG